VVEAPAAVASAVTSAAACSRRVEDVAESGSVGVVPHQSLVAEPQGVDGPDCPRLGGQLVDQIEDPPLVRDGDVGTQGTERSQAVHRGGELRFDHIAGHIDRVDARGGERGGVDLRRHAVAHWMSQQADKPRVGTASRHRSHRRAAGKGSTALRACLVGQELLV
jgi:hypothetical protein